ncbi:electron transfer flavoprotein [Enterobacteriaceae bacterium Kacie_13]|nr:electron transfer flavoprotein [Enterobacteriaceae bacterium Kacie_13]
MKLALIMDTRQSAFLTKAQELNEFLQASGWTTHSAELWLFYAGEKPSFLPQMGCPVSGIRWMSLPPPGLSEQQLEGLEWCCQQSPADVLLCASGVQGDELASRLASRLCGVSGAGVTQAERDVRWQIRKPAYGNRMQATLALSGSPLCVSVAACGAKPAATGRYVGDQQECPLPCAPPDWLTDFRQTPVQVDHGLQDALYILAVGQGVGSAENLRHACAIAAKMGAETGVSRPVAMNAWCEMSRMLGMSGIIAAPKVCIVAGASGAAALMAGLFHSEFIVAINTDPQAAIFAQADVGIVGDLQAVLEELSLHLSKPSP